MGLHSHILSILFTIILITTTTTILAADCTGTLVKLNTTKYPEARCLDGSPGAFYMQLVEGSKGWMIALEGGGECVTQRQCTSRAKTDLGTSNEYKDSMTMFQLQGCDSTNKFKDWNKVYIKYCSGDLFFGQDIFRTERAYGLQFSGYNIVRDTVNYLIDNYRLAQADEVILSGYSAGGLGVVTIADSIYDWLYLRIAPFHTPTQTTSRLIKGEKFLGPKVAIVPVAGYHFETKPIYKKIVDTDPSPVGFIPWQFEPDWREYFTLWNSTVPTRCVNEGKWKPYECMISQANFMTSITPWFVIQSTVDSIVLQLHGGCPQVWNPDSEGNKRCAKDYDESCPIGVKTFMHIWHGNMTDHIAQVETKHMAASILYPELYSQSNQQVQDSFGWDNNGENNSIKLNGAFASACLLHTEFGIVWPIIDEMNYRQALWDWWSDSNQYKFGEANPHFHIDRCPPGEILCGQCKK